MAMSLRPEPVRFIFTNLQRRSPMSLADQERALVALGRFVAATLQIPMHDPATTLLVSPSQPPLAIEERKRSPDDQHGSYLLEVCLAFAACFLGFRPGNALISKARVREQNAQQERDDINLPTKRFQ